jgi:hypothetical protein
LIIESISKSVSVKGGIKVSFPNGRSPRPTRPKAVAVHLNKPYDGKEGEFLVREASDDWSLVVPAASLVSESSTLSGPIPRGQWGGPKKVASERDLQATKGQNTSLGRRCVRFGTIETRSDILGNASCIMRHPLLGFHRFSRFCAPTPTATRVPRFRTSTGMRSGANPDYRG